jgi:hypothetical protein
MSMMAEGGPPPDDEMAEGPQPPQEEIGEGKQPQQAVNYRVGTPGKAPDGCEAVDGTISPFGYCDIYLQQPNPFGDTHQYTMSGGKIAPAGPPGLRIGNKTYE